MFNTPTMTDAECSPWPPVLWFTPEVQSGIKAAADLAFGPETSDIDHEVPAHDFLGEDDLIIE
jgi:hypothetical protein